SRCRARRACSIPGRAFCGCCLVRKTSTLLVAPPSGSGLVRRERGPPNRAADIRPPQGAPLPFTRVPRPPPARRRPSEASFSPAGTSPRSFSTRTPQDLRLVPGPHTFNAEGTTYDFTFAITAIGRFSYEPGLRFLSGQDTTTLVVGVTSTAPTAQSVMAEPSLVTSGLLLLVAGVARSRRARGSRVSA